MHPKKVSEIGAKWSQFGAVSETRSLTILQTRAFTLIGTAKRRKKKREERKKVRKVMHLSPSATLAVRQ